ncbi:MAG: hypothetical protein GY753_11355 [Gammaproteobacteria bacterium]|nr:hypothetical protein [Gammaproteobacteria bacterium]
MEQVHQVDQEKRRRNLRLALLLGGLVVLNAVVSLTLWISKFNQAAEMLK